MLYAQVIVKHKTKVEELTYSIPPHILPFIRVGSLVTVPLRRRVVTGVIVHFRRHAARELRGKLREITSVKRDQAPISETQIKVIEKLAKAIGATRAEVAFHALSLANPTKPGADKSRPTPAGKPVFVQGTTAKRLESYQQLITKYALKKNFLILFAQRSYATFFASTLGEKHKNVKIATIGEAFWPLEPGDFIIVDQPYHVGAESNQRPYLSTKQIALVRVETEGLNLVMGDTLVSLEDFPYIDSRQWRLTPAANTAKPLFVTDRRGSKQLVMTSMQERLASSIKIGQKVLALVLSRGWASALVCQKCGHLFSCSNCRRTISVHDRKLQCRYCGKVNDWPKTCPDCQGSELVAIGEGSAQFAKELTRLLPEAKIQELSADQPELKEDSQIVIATEKVFNFPSINFDQVFIFSADRLLSGAKLNGIGQLLSYLLELQGVSHQVSVQTYFPDHPIWGIAATGDIQAYYRAGLQSRRKLHLPPYGSLVTLRGQAGQTAAIFKDAGEITGKIERIFPKAEISYPEIVDKSGRNYVAEMSLLFPSRLLPEQKQKLARLLPLSWALAAS